MYIKHTFLHSLLKYTMLYKVQFWRYYANNQNPVFVENALMTYNITSRYGQYNF